MSDATPHPPHWEKRGNTTWVSCRSCQAWIPVEEDLIAAGDIDLRCHACGDSFLPEQAAKIVMP